MYKAYKHMKLLKEATKRIKKTSLDFLLETAKNILLPFLPSSFPSFPLSSFQQIIPELQLHVGCYIKCCGTQRTNKALSEELMIYWRRDV